MPTINDLKLANLATLGYSGTIDDAEFEYLGSLGHTGTIDDRRRQLWISAGFNNETEYLLDKGYTGSIDDMRLAAFTDDAYYAPPEYQRQDYWFRFQNTGSRIVLPLSSIASGSGVLKFQLDVGCIGITNSCVISSGTYNTSNALGAGITMASTGATLDGDIRSRLSVNTKFINNIHTVPVNTWITYTLIMDWNLSQFRYEFTSGHGPTSLSGNWAYTGATIVAYTPGTSFILGSPTNALFGGMSGTYRNVYLIENDVILGYWPLDDNSTTIADQSGNGNNGTLTMGTDSWVQTDPNSET